MGIDSAATKAANEANIRRWEFANQYKIDKACPFCNRTIAIVEQDKANEELYLVKCRECYAITPSAPTPEDAIKLWNDEIFPDYVWLTNKDVPYLNDQEIWGELKNAIVSSVFNEYKKLKKLAMKSWSSSPVMYDEYLRKARLEKMFFEDDNFAFFSTMSGKAVVDAADKQAKYDVLFRDKHRCRGCGNSECKHQKYIWWLWDLGNEYDTCIGWKKRVGKAGHIWTGGHLYRSTPT